MRTYVELAPIRLRDLLGPSAMIVEHGGWSWMGHSWWYEGIGFTWFGRLEHAPDRTVAFELFFEELSKDQSASLTAALGFRVAPGMPLEYIASLFGFPLRQ